MIYPARINRLRIVLLGLVGVALFVWLAGPASAAQVHVYSHSFGSGLSLTPQSGIAINQETGETYVADTKHGRIAKFASSGAGDGTLATLSEPTFIAVDNSPGLSKGDVYVVEGVNSVTKLDQGGSLVSGWATGGRLGGLGEILGVAVDSTGNLWVLGQTLEPTEGSVVAREFDQSGTQITQWEQSLEFGIRAARGGVGVDSADDLYVLVGDYVPGSTEPGVTFGPKVRKFGPAGEILISAVNTGESAGVATDLADNDVYLGNIEGPSPSVYRYSSAGQELERFGGEHEGPGNSGTVVDGLKTNGISSIATRTGGMVYVTDSVAGKVAVYELEEVPPPTVSIEPAGSITQTSAQVIGYVNPNAPAGSKQSHDIAWEFECTPACPGHDGHISVALDGSERTVEATIENLVPGTEYSVRLIGKNRGPVVSSPTESFKTAPAAPTVNDAPAKDVFRGGATLNAGINPNGAATTYHFEYKTKAAFEAEGFGGPETTRTAESDPIAPTAVVNNISVRISGLSPGTDYVYRAVATNSVGSTNGSAIFFRAQVGGNPLQTSCPNQLLRTGFGALLPDCRAYELVSPIEKSGNLIEPYESNLQAAMDGSGVAWYTGQAAAGIPAAGGAHQDPAFYLSTPLGDSWVSQRLLPPEQYGELAHLVGLTEDARYAVIETAVNRGGYEPGLYLLDTYSQALTAIVPPVVGQKVDNRAFVLDGSSSDDSLFFFESKFGLTGNAVSGKDNLYVWNRATGQISLAGALPGAKNEAPPGGSFGGAYRWWGGSESLDEGGAMRGQYVGSLHAISESGDSVYFTAGESGQLYLRRGLTGSKASSVRVSVANAGVNDPNGQQPAAFQEATPDGTKAFFLSSAKLTQNANTGPSDEGRDLYRYDAEAKKLVDVTPVPQGAGAQVQGLLGIARAGTSGYLVAEGVLALGGVAGKNNLYRFEEVGNTFAYAFVATLASSNKDTWNWSPISASPKTARVSDNGHTLIFMSVLPLTGGPSTAQCLYGTCSEVYRYSSIDDTLGCVSCNPTGEGAPLIGAELTTEGAPTILPENVPTYATLPRNLSSDGTRIFFQSAEGLLPEDTNGVAPRQNCTTTVTCGDVYEWEAVGTGSCEVPNQAGGCLSLLSDGQDDQSSYFVNASADGTSAFLITASQLVPVDEDQLADIYDVRVDGGLASQHVSSNQPCGTSDGCRGPNASPAAPTSPSSQSFQGAGNPKFKRCKKGFVRKHGKCVKKPKHHKKKRHGKPKRHKNEGGAKKKGQISHKKHSGGKK